MNNKATKEQSGGGARRSRRFNVQNEAALKIPARPALCELKRRERRAPAK
jgi:hypothetical protein